MDLSRLASQATAFGFTRASRIDVQDLKLGSAVEVRGLCAANACGNFGKNWCCPPAVGPVEDCVSELLRHGEGVVVQCVGDMEDSYDIEGSARALAKFRELFMGFLPTARQEGGLMALGAGGCALCPTCAYPDAACRHPEKALPSVESYGINVMALCRLARLPYHSGANTVTFTGLYLFETGGTYGDL